ncbi:UNVERIFIED_ORG: sigma-E factor negative regulatory protein RseA [Pseudomonas parafulva]|jgi:sigma-E factor negative regulatory protein RseA|uniref:RNA polymerase sigma-H factor AlgU n=1 Tax=Pseudomonas parafulva TaxID=157782 RepID=A0AAJ0LHZ8_9PSED|nr:MULTISPECIES: RseA family anti-sigma factor [Pseudomonas]MCY4125962.1 RseA family anti-sigma factor [Pseudomonas sp.]MDP9663119.1 sigma-E factor negative regulatory protein RseA [Pseudomonas cremoricolorata]AQW67597.1 RNA polymerase subunit sigma [Pseudomonas parafulva]AUA32047.1 RNA polymerase subunit sigma [Pseudomonas sp. SGAir0191]AVF54530.1 RNA polymerase subunit sigma [Pseudomonas fulva]
MSREALQESLSAVMDNEADQLELRRVLNAVDDAETRATWSRYQVARAAMHKELLLPNLDIASAVSAALADEAVPAKAKQGPWRTVSRVAVAASVTLAVLAGVRLYNQDDITGAQLAAQQPVQQGVTVPQAQGPAVLAGYSESSDQPTGPMANGVLQNQAGWDQRLPGYLRQHAQESALKGSETALPYARAASLENR